MIKNFIGRPMLSTVIFVLIVILGVLGIVPLLVSQYPDIAPATVSVKANYGETNVEAILKSMVIPLKEQINGVESMGYIVSSVSNSGAADITVYFKNSTDPDNATVLVQNRISYANAILPAEVKQARITIEKREVGQLMFLTFSSSNPEFGEVYLENYLGINIIPALRRITGVDDADEYGGKSYSMRTWLDSQKLQAYKLTPTEINTATSARSLEAAAGTLGQNSGSSYEYTIRYKGKYNSISKYKNIVIKALDGERILRLKDMAKVELDALDYINFSESKGRAAIATGVSQTPGASAHEVVQDIKKYLKSIEKDLPKGVAYTVNSNINTFLDTAISKVLTTLLGVFLLVFLVVHIFLQDFRSTLVPAITVPVSIVGTFFFLDLFGYPINMLTPFALVLAIGIVVDGAIVVVEAVHAKMEQAHEKAKPATVSTMNEITGAIVSITLMMATVFVSVTFIEGTTGVFYKQFGVTLIVVVAISATDALTLNPVLCSLFLRPHGDKEYEDKSVIGKFFHKLSITFNAATLEYRQTFTFLLRHKQVTLVLFTIVRGGIYFAGKSIQTGFVPNGNQGFILMNLSMIPGASMERVANKMHEVSKDLDNIPGVKNFTFVTGNGMLSDPGNNSGMGFFKLRPFEECPKDPRQSMDAIVGQVFAAASKVKDAEIVFFQPPAVSGFGMGAGVSFALPNKSGADVTEIDKTAQELIAAFEKQPEVKYAKTFFNTNYPQYEMITSVKRAMQSGISVNTLLSTLQSYIGGYHANDSTLYSKQFRVVMQTLPDVREDMNSLNEIFVRIESSEMAPISECVTLKRVFDPQAVSRYNLYTSADILATNSESYSTGDVVKVVEEVAAQTLNTNYGIDYTGLTREKQNVGSQTIVIFILSLVFTYSILSIQYENYLLPLSVLVSLPFGIFGACLGQWLFGLEDNTYFQISLIMPMGLLAKNTILIVEFTVRRRRMGESLSKVVIDTAMARSRPILMTSFTFIVGLLPLVSATGVGAAGNRSVTTRAAIGQLTSTFFGLVVIPVLFVIFQDLQEHVSGRRYKTDEILATPTEEY